MLTEFEWFGQSHQYELNKTGIKNPSGGAIPNVGKVFSNSDFPYIHFFFFTVLGLGFVQCSV